MGLEYIRELNVNDSLIRIKSAKHYNTQIHHINQASDQTGHSPDFFVGVPVEVEMTEPMAWRTWRGRQRCRGAGRAGTP